MKRALSLWIFLWPVLCLGHIGTTTVVTDGSAGPYRLRVVIRPPDVIPGRAQIDVRLLDPDQRDATVTVLPVSAAHGLKGAPRPDQAEPVRGDSALRHGELWLMTTGSYSVHVDVAGTAGQGKFIVPVDAMATRSLAVPKPLGAMLLVMGAVLFSGAVTLVSSGARQSVTPPAALASPKQKRRSLAIALGAAAVFCFAILQLKHWWGYEDWIYRNKIIYRASPLSAQAWTTPTGSYAHLTIQRPNDGDPEGAAPITLLADHGKLMHLFAIREPQLDAFAHLHPVLVRPGEFALSLPPLPAGEYRLYSDITYENGFAATLTTTLTLPGAAGPVASENQPPADPDDSWSLGAPDPTAPSDAVHLVQTVPLQPRAGVPLSLAFTALDAKGSPAQLQPYLGMLGHAAVRRSDGSVFAHLHPAGTVSMAALQFFERQAGLPTEASTANEPDKLLAAGAVCGSDLAFPFEFPTPGSYRVWVQAKVDGKVVTQVFNYTVGQRD